MQEVWANAPMQASEREVMVLTELITHERERDKKKK